MGSVRFNFIVNVKTFFHILRVYIYIFFFEWHSRRLLIRVYVLFFAVIASGNGIDNSVSNNIKENAVNDAPRSQRSKSQKSASKRSGVNDKPNEQPSMVNGTSA